MIRASAPLRLPLGGGGTDLPSYYTRRGGFLVAAALRDAVRVTLRTAAEPSAAEDPWVRQALLHLGAPAGVHAEVESDAPAGSGLGGSGALLVALAHALRALKGERAPARDLAEQAFDVERLRMGRPVGKQDSYAAACGGIVALSIEPGGRTVARRLRLGGALRARLERSLLLVDTGRRRDASVALAAQEGATSEEGEALRALDRIRALGERCARLLESGRSAGLGSLFRSHWEIKRTLTPHTATPEAQRCLDLGLAVGARGGKLIGAGGGGFVLFDCGPRRRAVQEALGAEGFATRGVRLRARGSRLLGARSSRARPAA